jgi:hypothetical protein
VGVAVLAGILEGLAGLVPALLLSWKETCLIDIHVIALDLQSHIFYSTHQKEAKGRPRSTKTSSI